MYFGYALVGFIVGAVLAGGGSDFLLGAGGGIAVGLLLARVHRLERRTAQLESAAGDAARVSPLPVPPPAPEPAAAEQTWERPGPQASEPFEISRVARTATPELPTPALPTWLDVLLGKAKSWLTTGNIPVKVGVVVSFVGVSFLLKYAFERRLLVLPLEVRLLAVAAAGVALLVIGWRLRHKVRVYALSLQGGGAGILFLTIFAALRLWQLLPAALAFALLVALTAGTGALAVLQNARSLAILGVVGGFLAPVLTSTGQGSHVALFSYYLVLNGAIVGIAWFRAWRELNLVGFVFTFVIGSFWGYRYYTPELWAGTQPFLLLHFLLYQAIAILYALRQPPDRIGLVDGTLVFGTPVVALALQAALMRGSDYGLAISAAAAAVFYAVVATALFRRRAPGLRLLVESYLALAVAFATLAIPLALDARWTSAAWALEGAALVWVGTRQGRQLAKLAGTALIGLSGLAFLDGAWRSGAGLPVLNGDVLGGLLISLSAFFAARRLGRVPEQRFVTAHRVAALGLFLWALLWWLGTGWAETEARAPFVAQYTVYLLFVGASGALAAWLGGALAWPLLSRSVLLLLPLLAVLAQQDHTLHGHFLHGLGWLAWPAIWAAQVYGLRRLDQAGEPLAAAWHLLSVLLLTLLLALEAYWWTGRVASAAWALAAASAVAGIVSLLIWRLRRTPAWPVPAHPTSYLAASLVLITAQLLFLTALAVAQPGSPHPWPYLPVLNPFDLAMLFALLTALLSLTVLRRDRQSAQVAAVAPALPLYRALLAVAFFALTTLALVRGVHHFAAVPWDRHALYDSVVVQTALAIYWGLLGFAGMLWGARRAQRALWLIGAGFMALVVVKLFLIDLGNTGTVERIVSFIGIGILLLVVGYFAPVPPRHAADVVAGEGRGLQP